MSKRRFYEGQIIDTAYLDKSCQVIFEAHDKERKLDKKVITCVCRDSKNYILNTKEKTIILIPVK
ncbi:hypothetical protein UFOVP105_40 [uncultured Caudovirales phage]|uniref:Uncharacterized protein n=1 Tax=uncultured Caudovirales phage TaxID=2100421 RepID=A0A6J5L265_9CAUD|nr:hypothetical protein UFOVP105_40 [uncultured Caudovirales phage]